MIVDDEPETCELLTVALQAGGAEVRVCVSATPWPRSTLLVYLATESTDDPGRSH
jgi:hypothetical protein